jgi:hypothetical protein
MTPPSKPNAVAGCHDADTARRRADLSGDLGRRFPAVRHSPYHRDVVVVEHPLSQPNAVAGCHDADTARRRADLIGDFGRGLPIVGHVSHQRDSLIIENATAGTLHESSYILQQCQPAGRQRTNGSVDDAYTRTSVPIMRREHLVALNLGK